MASLPPGWTADYDGQRWFFTYGPTGQSQFQFPRPGDEFPDFLLCCGAGGTTSTLPEVELSPEERLESERQVRRQLLYAGGRGRGGTKAEAVDDDDGGLLVPRLSPVRQAGGEEGIGAVCFGNFAAVRSSGARGLGGGREEGTRTVGQSGQSGGDAVGIPSTTGVVDVSRESSGEPVFVPHAIKGKHTPTTSSPHRESGSTAAMSITSELVMAVAEIKNAAPSIGHQIISEHQLAPVAQPSPPGLSLPDGRTMESADTAPWVLCVGVIPELYSESTAFCEEEINPPPVELPGDETGENSQIIIPNEPVQSPVELPAYEAPGVSLGNGESAVRLEQKYLARDYAAISKAGPGEVSGAQRRGHDRAGLPSQASKRSPEKSFDRTSFSERLNSTRDRKLSSVVDTDPPKDKARSETRDLTHFPSILRPGPRRSSGQHRPPPPPVVSASVTNTSHVAAHAQLRHQPRGQKHEEEAGACLVPQKQPARMPTEPPLPTHARESQRVASTVGPEAPRAPGGGLRQDRLPGSVNFVIPIRHISRDEIHYDASGDAAAAGGGSLEYQVGASFASATSFAKSDPAAGGQASRENPGLVPGRKKESWGWRADEADPVQLVGGRSDAAIGADWSWGWAR